MEKEFDLGLTKDEFDTAIEDIADDLEDFELPKTKIVYEVWLLGEDADHNATDFEWYIDGEYTEEAEARKCFEYFSELKNVKEFIETHNVITTSNTGHLRLVLEMCDTSSEITECLDILEEVEIY